MEYTGNSIYCCNTSSPLFINGCLYLDCLREIDAGNFELRNTANDTALYKRVS